MSIKNIVFDFWGVLFFEDTDKFSQQIADKLPDSEEKLDKIKKMMKELIKIARNNESVNSWIEKYEELTGLKGFTADVWGENFFTNKNLEIWMKENQRNYNLYYLTNINPFRFAKCQEADLFEFFQGGVASCDVGVRKPNPQIYQILLDKYNLKPEESLFIDDKLGNVEAAQKLGFQTILFEENVDLAEKIADC
jgi:FMN phosphatase YigB (HAD superfamily)